MSRIVPLSLLTLIGIALVGGGVVLNAWWTIAAGVGALTLAAWLVTEPR